MLVADQRHLGDENVVLELVLDGLRSDELAAGGLQQFFLAIGDVEEAVLIEVADVAGAEPAVAVETLGIGLRFVPVAGEKPRDREPAVPRPRQISVRHWAAACPPRPCDGWAAS